MKFLDIHVNNQNSPQIVLELAKIEIITNEFEFNKSYLVANPKLLENILFRDQFSCGLYLLINFFKHEN